MKFPHPGEWLGALRVVGISSAFWLAVYRAECVSGLARWRTPLRVWRDVESSNSKKTHAPPPNSRTPYFFDDGLSPKRARPTAPEERKRLMSELADLEQGTFPFWGGTRAGLGFPPEWNRNPLTGCSQPPDRHWTQTPENASGDVKGMWELSRFTVVFRLARIYARCGEERAAEDFWRLVESWLDANPPNAGVQWLSAQEAALRLMAWEFGRNAFVRSAYSTDERVNRLAAAIGEHARRIEATISYARAQNNNHLIAEAAGLVTTGWMHPELPGAARWARLGRMLLEQSAGQFFSDGGYIQHSHNYHRFALQLCVWSMRLAELHELPFSPRLYAKMRASLAFLRSMIDPQTGHVPNLGHNDGTLFLPLSTCEYADYRPLVQMLSLWLDHKPAYPGGAWDEEPLWMLGVAPQYFTGEHQDIIDRQFPNAGLFQMTGKETRMILRAARLTSRPAHSDQLHVDLWWRGENVACDAGSFLYSGDPPWQNPFTGAAAHNTVAVDDQDPMRRSGRFLWTRLAQAEVVRSGDDALEARHDGYRRLGVVHRRVVTRIGADDWRVEDILEGTGTHKARLHWLVPDVPWERVDMARGQLPDDGDDRGPKADLRCFALHFPVGTINLTLSASAPARWNIVRAGELVYGDQGTSGEMPMEVCGWRSERYGEKTPALSIVCVCTGILPLHLISIWSCEEAWPPKRSSPQCICHEDVFPD